MQSSFELFDLISGNVFDVYERESEAMHALVEIALARGLGEVSRFALTFDCHGDSTLIAMEDDLVRRVEAARHKLIGVHQS